MDHEVQYSEHEDFLRQHPEIRLIELLVPDNNGVLRGKRVTVDKLASIYQDGIYLPGSLFCMSASGDSVEGVGLVWSDGDSDRTCRPVPGTLTPVPWHKEGLGQLLMTMHENDGTPFFADPRHVLDGVVARFRDMGLRPVVAVELEFHLLDIDPDDDGRPQPPISPATGNRENSNQVYGIDELHDYGELMEEIAEAARLQGLPADTMVAEYAPGQYEVNLHHVDDPLRAAEHAILLKRLIKGVARRHGMEATFMAKPYSDQVGNGTHIHVSLLDASGRNVFAGEDGGITDRLRHAIGGLQAMMVESMSIFAPNPNSSKRFVADSYAPLAPTWGINNRTVALRIPNGNAQATRIEHRVAGADANPYLVLAAVLAGIHHGLVGQLDPGAPITGNAYAQVPPSLPFRQVDVQSAFAAATVLPEYLGVRFCEVYLGCRRADLERFEQQISALEYQWFLRTV